MQVSSISFQDLSFRVEIMGLRLKCRSEGENCDLSFCLTTSPFPIPFLRHSCNLESVSRAALLPYSVYPGFLFPCHLPPIWFPLRPRHLYQGLLQVFRQSCTSGTAEQRGEEESRREQGRLGLLSLSRAGQARRGFERSMRSAAMATRRRWDHCNCYINGRLYQLVFFYNSEFVLKSCLW